MDSETRICQNCKKDFTIESEDFNFYEKIKVPPPTFCPECRNMRRMTWHNERNLFRLKSGRSGKEIFSMFPPNANIVVYDRPEWTADDWDQEKSGMEYGWDKPFLEQFKELMTRAPIPSRSIMRLVNSDYCNNGTNLKNCYLIFGCQDVENGAYMENSVRTKDSLDVSLVSDSELSYECFFNVKCYRALYSSFCKDCQDIYFCRDCVGCSSCFGCVGLNGKSHHIFNQPYSKEEYNKRIKEFNIGSCAKKESLKKEVSKFWLQYPVRFAKNYKNTNCAGEYITNSKNVKKSYQVDGGEDLKYCHGVYAKPSRDSYDQYRYGGNSELIYESAVSGGNSTGLRFCHNVYDNCREIEYSWVCNTSNFLFGCIGLHHKQYCILNKQYSKEEYEKLVPKIIEHMNTMPYVDKMGRVYKYGEFFPSEFSPFAYNQSVVMEYFPFTKEGAENSGYLWAPTEHKSYKITLPSDKIPDSISETKEDIFSEIIGCEHNEECNHGCTKAFRIIPKELQFYKRLNIPIPHLCPNCRYFERILQRSKVKMHKRTCQCAGAKSENGTYQNTGTHFHGAEKCEVEFETSYAPDQPEIVYCEKCYQQEVY